MFSFFSNHNTKFNLVMKTRRSCWNNDSPLVEDNGAIRFKEKQRIFSDNRIHLSCMLSIGPGEADDFSDTNIFWIILKSIVGHTKQNRDKRLYILWKKRYLPRSTKEKYYNGISWLQNNKKTGGWKMNKTLIVLGAGIWGVMLLLRFVIDPKATSNTPTLQFLIVIEIVAFVITLAGIIKRD